MNLLPRIIATFLLTVIFIFNSYSQRLDLFTSNSGKIKSSIGTEKVPYERTTSFYDYIDSTQIADILVEDKHYYFVYFKIPMDVTEIGIRIISPVPDNVSGNRGDFETEAYTTNQQNKSKYFDTRIALEQRIDNNIKGAGQSNRYSWSILGENDNSSEVMEQPSGKYRNSLIRVNKTTLTAGIYRIRICDADKFQPEGSYLLQLGLVPGLKGIKISRSFGEILDEN